MFFFRLRTAYKVRICDRISDVRSSDQSKNRGISWTETQWHCSAPPSVPVVKRHYSGRSPSVIRKAIGRVGPAIVVRHHLPPDRRGGACAALRPVAQAACRPDRSRGLRGGGTAARVDAAVVVFGRTHTRHAIGHASGRERGFV